MRPKSNPIIPWLAAIGAAGLSAAGFLALIIGGAHLQNHAQTSLAAHNPPQQNTTHHPAHITHQHHDHAQQHPLEDNQHHEHAHDATTQVAHPQHPEAKNHPHHENNHQETSHHSAHDSETTSPHDDHTTPDHTTHHESHKKEAPHHAPTKPTESHHHDDGHSSRAPSLNKIKHTAHWGYHGKIGPEYWGKISQDYATCALGHHQSPIDINVRSHQIGSQSIQFFYRPEEVNLLHNGHTLQVNYPSGSYIIIGDKRYDLQQFHFHAPSEHTINGTPYEMELHLVHANQRGDIAVIGILMEEKHNNPSLAQIWQHLPLQPDKKSHAFYFDLNALLPKDHDYYAYSGSLTTPPCSEPVAWHILKHPIQVSAKQVDQFLSLIGPNARPVQPLYSRHATLNTLAH